MLIFNQNMLPSVEQAVHAAASEELDAYFAVRENFGGGLGDPIPGANPQNLLTAARKALRVDTLTAGHNIDRNQRISLISKAVSIMAIYSTPEEIAAGQAYLLRRLDEVA